MYEAFYGLREKPFSITPDPKFFFQSDSHKGALELLLHGVRNKDGFMVITGDIGTGKTTLCRALLESLDDKVFTALILNPFLSEDDLLKVTLQDFGVVSRETKRELAGASKQELIELLNQFLLNTLSIGGNALLIIDEAQNLPLPTLEQIRILSNLETNKEKLLQIVLAGQLGLIDILRSEQLRQLDQRIASRYQIGPILERELPRYVNHRLMVAGSKGNTHFSPGALQLIYYYSHGLPRLINLLCDRALLSGFAAQSHTITKEMAKKAAETLDLPATAAGYAYKLKGGGFWSRYRRALVAGLAFLVVLVAILAFWSQISSAVGAVWPSAKQSSNSGVGSSGIRTSLDERIPAVKEAISKLPEPKNEPATRPDATPPPVAQVRPPAPFAEKQYRLDPNYPFTLLIGSYQAVEQLKKTMSKLEALGYRTYVATVDLQDKGTWHRLLVGRFKNVQNARKMADEIKEYGEFPYAQVMSAERASNR